MQKKQLIVLRVTEKVIQNCDIIQPKLKLAIVKEDSDDNKILECAVAGKVNFVISQDNHLLKIGKFRGIPIIKPNEFLKRVMDN